MRGSPSSSLVCVGINHKTASVARRERAAFSPQSQIQVLQVVAAGQIPAISQLVILSTCNRSELYAVHTADDQNCVPQSGWDALRELFLSHTRLSPDSLSESSYQLRGQEAVWHLFQVAAGLDSLVIGEPQILGQLVRAYEQAHTQGATGTLLSVLMQRAIRAGKRVRHETPLQTGALSISTVAVRQAEQVLGDLRGATALVIGAGKMARPAAMALARPGIGRLLISNRTLESGARLARDCGGEVVAFEALGTALNQAQIVITAVSADEPLITPALLERTGALRLESTASQVILDLGLPRNVDSKVRALPGIHLYDLDDLRTFAESVLVQRSSAIAQVETLLCEELMAFERWQAERAAIPAIHQLHMEAQALQQVEVQRLLSAFPELTPQQRLKVERSNRRLINAHLHESMLRLKTQAVQERL